MLLRPGGPGGKNYLREEEGGKKTKKNKKGKKNPHKTRKTLHLGLPHLIFFLN